MGQLVTFVENMCFELIGFNKILVKYFECGMFSYTVCIL